MKNTTRILLLKMDHIGDALWAFPAIRALRSAFPASAIDMLCTPYLAEAFRRADDLTEVVEYDVKAALGERSKILRSLRSRNYDVAIVLGPVDKVNHLAFLSGARERIGYAYAGNPLHALMRQVYLTRSFPHPADAAGQAGLPLPHEVRSMLSLVEKSGAAATGDAQLFFSVTQPEKESARSLLQDLLPGKAGFAALHLCAKSFSHGWNADTFAALARQLQEALPDAGWIVTAGPAEEPFLDAYRSFLQAAEIPVVTGLNLAGMAALLSQTQLLISWDTGVVHLASAVGIPVVDIFPARNYDYCIQRWGPWGENAASLAQTTEQLDCAQISVIVAAAKRLLDRSVSDN